MRHIGLVMKLIVIHFTGAEIPTSDARALAPDKPFTV
ncbi:hypothetical protein LTSEMIS_0280, partial [Salmonella enterica subsp. enterica serovar Mississippi str. A4-633]